VPLPVPEFEPVPEALEPGLREEEELLLRELEREGLLVAEEVLVPLLL